jgi:putative DNA primase/helicase
MLKLDTHNPGRPAPPDYRNIADHALQLAPKLVPSWLPQGQRRGDEWVALNPTRSDQSLGSFSINLRTGRWADFSTGDGGGDLISLRAYLDRTTQRQAALALQRELGGSMR